MKNQSFQSLFAAYLGLFSLFFCIAPKSIVLLIAGLLVFVVIGYMKKEFQFTLSKPLIFLALFYVAYLIGMFFTKHPHQAGIYAENKLSFLVFPLLLAFRSTKPISLLLPLVGLSLGIVIYTGIGLFHAFNCNAEAFGQLGCFTGSVISPLHHPSYFSVFILVALAGNWQGFLNKQAGFSLKWILPFTLVAGMMYILCFSLAGFLFLFFFLFFLLGKWIYRKLGKKMTIVVVCLFPLLFFLAFFSVPRMKAEVMNTKHSLDAYLADPEGFVRSRNTAASGNDVRLVMWTVAGQKMIENPWGVGTGNVDDHLRGRLLTLGQADMVPHEYNPHNQFLQTGMEIGFPGLAILLSIIVSGIVFGIRNKNGLLILLLTSLAFNSLFESMLQRHSGIVFYSFWMCLLVVYSLSQQKSPENHAD